MVVDESVTLTHAENYQFFQLIETLYQSKNVNLDALLDLMPDYEPIRFIGDPSLAFATRDITSVQQQYGKYHIKLPFLNLTGAHSPLPNFYLDSLSWEEQQEEPRLLTLLNIFNHRLITFLYKIWRKYRYSVCFKEGGTDEYSQRMYSLVGLGNANIRESLHINSSKMLSYAGILASSSRSPQILAALIAHCFELQHVEINSWQFRRVPIPEPQRNKIGMVNAVLSKNFIIGDHIPDYSGKFILTINELSQRKMQMFLPTGTLHHSLINFVSFVLQDQFAWDLQLNLASDQAGCMTLGENTECYLGWTAFLGAAPTIPSILITIQD